MNAIILIKILTLFITCNTEKEMQFDLKNGFYYGRNKGFVPQNIVYIYIENDSALTECYLPFKGEFFHTFSDTLILNHKDNILYKSETSLIYIEKGKLHFKTTEKSDYKIENTQISYSPDKKNEYKEVKSKSKPYKSNN